MGARAGVRRGGAALAALLAAAAAGGCGGADQSAGEPAGRFPVEVTRARFPARQRVSEPATMRVAVRNAGRRTIPDLAVSVTPAGEATAAPAFAQTSRQAGLASSSRPIWIVDAGPRDGATADPRIWALGPLPPGREATFVWRVVPVVAGRYAVSWRVAAGLTGRARARLRGGGEPQGTFGVRISARAPAAIVDARGDVVSVGR